MPIPHRKQLPPLNPSMVALVLASFLGFVLLFTWGGGARKASLSDCVEVTETTARLACYDDYAKTLHKPAK